MFPQWVVATWDRRGTIDCRGTRGCTRESTARQEDGMTRRSRRLLCHSECRSTKHYCLKVLMHALEVSIYRVWSTARKKTIEKRKQRLDRKRTLQNASESGSTSGTTDSSSDTSDSSDWKKRLRSTWKWEEVFDSLLFTIRIPWNMQGIRTWWPKTWKTIIHSSKIDDIQLDNKYWPWPIWFMVQITPISLSHMLHVWYIYLQHWVIFGRMLVNTQAPWSIWVWFMVDILTYPLVN